MRLLLLSLGGEGREPESQHGQRPARRALPRQRPIDILPTVGRTRRQSTLGVGVAGLVRAVAADACGAGGVLVAVLLVGGGGDGQAFAAAGLAAAARPSATL